jgi:hypothetical protein
MAATAFPIGLLLGVVTMPPLLRRLKGSPRAQLLLEV